MEVARVPRVAASTHKRPLPGQLAETHQIFSIGLRANTLNVMFAANPAAMHVWHAPFENTQLERYCSSFQRIEG
jgi:hypothetical protein